MLETSMFPTTKKKKSELSDHYLTKFATPNL